VVSFNRLSILTFGLLMMEVNVVSQHIDD
jgi:hypothetical protein